MQQIGQASKPPLAFRPRWKVKPCELTSTCLSNAFVNCCVKLTCSEHGIKHNQNVTYSAYFS